MRIIDGDHLKSILQEYVKREKSYVELGEFPTKLIASCMISGLEEAIAQIDSEASLQSETCAYWDRESNFCALHRPSAQPKRIKGKWIISHVPESMLWECDQCGFDCGAHSFNYCPNCGADMRKKEPGYTMEEFMYGQDPGSLEDGSL